jgi:cation transport ATPase
VGYLGDVIHDIPALARADVAIGLDFDEAGMLTNKLCDLCLSRDPQWLPRLVVLSRSLKRTADGNAVMIGLTHLLSSVATAGLTISPLQTVLLADIPLVLAELRSINSFRSRTHSTTN